MKRLSISLLLIGALVTSVFLPTVLFSSQAIAAGGTITVYKVIPPDGPKEVFTFKAYHDLNANGILDASEIIDPPSGEVSIDTLVTNMGTITVPFNGAYFVREVLGPGSVYQQPPDQYIIDAHKRPKSVTFTNELGELGCLEVTKFVDLESAVDPNSITMDFDVTVVGPSYPVGITHTFHLENGVIADPNPWQLCDLAPGDYYVTEADYTPLWVTVIADDDPAVVTADETAIVGVTNTYIQELGCLEVTKFVNLESAVDPNSITMDFDVTVVGPSYPGGITHTFHLENGVIDPPNPWLLCDLAPGDYYVTEADYTPLWVTVIAGDDPAVVTPDETAIVGVTNTYIQELGCLEVTKFVDFDDVLDPNSITQDFEVTVSGPSGVFNHTFHLENGVIDPPNPWLLCDLAPGDYYVTEADYTPLWVTVIAGDDPAVVPAIGAAIVGVTNTYIPGEAHVIKTTNGGPNPDPFPWTFTLTGPGGVDVEGIPVDGVIDFGNVKLIPGEAYTLTECGIMAGWNSEWFLDGVPIVPTQTDGCLSYTFTVEPGQEREFAINNTYTPNGGMARTPGYWKNWTTCDGKGKQAETAAKNGGWEAGFWLLDDIIGTGGTTNPDAAPILIGDLSVNTCQIGVYILDDRDLDGNKKGGDAAYHLARNLLAAKLNYGAGACTPPEATQAMTEAQALLSKIGFNGEGDYLSAKAIKNGLGTQEDRDEAIKLAEILDNYNNGEYCP